jgi:transposase
MRLNQLLREHRFDDFAEAECATFYAATMGRPGLPPGVYFRLLLIGYFEGIDSERGIAWRAADSFALRDFLGVGLDSAPPDHSTISRTRRLIDLETHRAVFTWVLQCLSTAGLVKGKTTGIDATTLEWQADACHAHRGEPRPRRVPAGSDGSTLPDYLLPAGYLHSDETSASGQDRVTR